MMPQTTGISAVWLSRKRTGYTLIELLVVIAIIVILLSLLLPLFATVLENGHRGNCISDQRKIAQAVLICAEDNQQMFPQVSTVWKGLKLSQKVLSCPSQTGEGIGYDYSCFINGRPRADILQPAQEIVTVDGIDRPTSQESDAVAASNIAWTSSVAVSPGDQLIINASGFATYDTNVDITDPNGQRWKNGIAEGIYYDPIAIVPSAPVGALVGRILLASPTSPGTTSTAVQPAPFLVGSATQINVSEKGTLQFIYNIESPQFRTASGAYAVNVQSILASTKGVMMPITDNLFSTPEDLAFRHGGKAVASFCDGHVAAISKLPPYWLVDIADASEFDTYVLQCPVPVLVEFYAPWSPWSLQMDQVIAYIASECRGQVQVVKVNGDLYPQLMRHYQVTEYPTLTFFKAGTPCGVIAGYDLSASETIESKLTALGVKLPPPLPPPQ